MNFFVLPLPIWKPSIFDDRFGTVFSNLPVLIPVLIYDIGGRTMKCNNSIYPYPSQRTAVYAKHGMVNTSQYLASQAGLAVLKKGGNAIDAIIAAASCLTVVEPTSNGIGGDAFALVWNSGRLYGLNASGPAPAAISAEELRNAGYQRMPAYGWAPVTVPGIPSAWAALSARFGKLPLTQVLGDAIDYAGNGFAVSSTVSSFWKLAAGRFSRNLKDEQYRYWFDTFAPGGNAPEAGDIVRLPDHAKTLQLIAETGAESFYRGEIAERIDRFSKKYGGYLRKEDLEKYRPAWVEPIRINYRGYDVCEIPPNGQGLVALMALNLLKGFEFGEKESAETYHRQIEATKLAFEDGLRYIADPAWMKVKVEDLLSESYAAQRRQRITGTAVSPEPGQPNEGGTVYLAAADGEGNMVSYIQSNYMGFGSGLVVPGTGIGLHNRGNNFSLTEGHANCLAPGKKPYHTIIPGFLVRDNQPVGPFGVMGGFMQPQGHVQVVMNLIDFGLNPQSALDAPRWQWLNDKKVIAEHGIPAHIISSLVGAGHDICWSPHTASFGRGQIILRLENGALIGGTDPRADSCAAAW